MNRLNALIVGLIAGPLMLTACGPTQAENAPGDTDKPSRVEPIAGTTTSRVILSAVAAERLGIQAEPVRAASTASPGQAKSSATSTVVPAKALVYDKNGGVWVYAAVPGAPTNAKGLPLTYARNSVNVERIDGDIAVLKSGPIVGTQVVTEGAEELLGTEYGVEGQQSYAGPALAAVADWSSAPAAKGSRQNASSPQRRSGNQQPAQLQAVQARGALIRNQQGVQQGSSGVASQQASASSNL
ncbi:MAG: hypothetical protein M3082_04330 [Candidatus Dormibacteraeota bacterium]|nr:hypothetical protein [Candidatus Dormibacteraeota bacterium]